jgi:protein SCO1/2
MKFINIILCVVLIQVAGVNHAGATSVIETKSTGLIDETGKQAAIDDYNGLYRLVFFGYTHCPDVCPLTMYYVATALRSLGEAANSIRVLFISIDPKRDTPEALAKYTDAFHPSIIGFTGSYDDLKAAASGFRATFGYTVEEDGSERTLSPEEYETMPVGAPYVPFHSSQIYLLDREGTLLDIIGYGSKPADIAAKIRENIDIDEE